MKVSVIIPTYNGAHRIGDLLHSIQHQSFAPDEVIVVVDGSTDGTNEVLAKWQPLIPSLKIVSQPNMGRAAVRNNGAKHASGDLLVFFDDDMLPEAECIATHYNAHQHLEKSVIMGSIPDYAGYTDFQRFRKSLSEKWEAPLIAFREKPMDLSNIYLSAANFSIPAKVFELLGGFDQRIRDAEDFDLAVRAIKKGVSIYFQPGARAWHNDPVTTRSYIKRLRQYRVAHQQLRNLEPDRYRDIPFHAPLIPKGIKKLVFSFFAHAFWIRWADSRYNVWYTPRFLRFRLYDWIVTANGVYFPERVHLS